MLVLSKTSYEIHVKRQVDLTVVRKDKSDYRNAAIAPLVVTLRMQCMMCCISECDYA